jgi:hypothetical protein
VTVRPVTGISASKLVRWLCLSCVLLLAIAIVGAGLSATAKPVIIASSSLTLTAPPAIIVAASDAHIWVVANDEQKFIRVDELTGEQTSYGFANGGGFVVAATVGQDGSLWYLDGLNNTAVWRIRSDGRYESTEIFARTHSIPGKLAGDELGDVWVTTASSQSITKITAAGSLVTLPVPNEYRYPGLLVRDSDGVLWFSTEVGIAWRDRRGHFGGFKTASPNYVRSCLGGGAAYLSLARETYAHADDYIVGWATIAGGHREVRRWHLPAAPTPKPMRVILLPVSCGLCGGGLGKPRPSRIVLLGCTKSTAWVRVGDMIERVRDDGHVDDVALGALGIVSNLANAMSPRVWIYDSKGQRLLELALR